ncbi:HTH-type transcriptional repressor PurR [Caloramator mitchellensis]|uniref:HTH-type transcriptional repressor PurR n=1 Tax=Caloramator mitchellensis TaxID=908809 RepID=A0A0R3JSN1_CALMK|nr:LacI family DNA-binding transcriptional regulator [Caloramator mitchellensis]KRQ86512.1 HTH-type transcriptional repressor PurR [Caloramator mitchellensis]
MITIRDIARKANVSIATVSRILNNDKTLSVSDETREKILKIVDELGYKPLRKRDVKKQDDKVENALNIGILLAYSEQDEANDPYFLSIRQGIEKECSEKFINISSIVRLDGNKFNFDLNEFDGLIVVGGIEAKDFKNLYNNRNVVFVDHAYEIDEYDSVISSFEKATENVIDYLVSMGHKEIGYIGGRKTVKRITSNEVIEIEDVRLQVYRKKMKELGLYSERNIYIGDWNPSGGYKAMKGAIENGSLPSAFIIASDPMSTGALHALHEANINVPDDVAIISFDDIESAAYLNPPLTTVKTYTEEMGKAAVKLLLERARGREIPIQVVVPTKLIIRKSCGGNDSDYSGYIFYS